MTIIKKKREENGWGIYEAGEQTVRLCLYGLEEVFGFIPNKIRITKPNRPGVKKIHLRNSYLIVHYAIEDGSFFSHLGAQNADFVREVAGGLIEYGDEATIGVSAK